MLAEKVAYRQQNQMALDMRVDKARLLLSRELTKSTRRLSRLSLVSGVRSAPIHDELEGVASPRSLRLSASLSAQIPDSELRDVHSALYSKVRVHLSELNINVYARRRMRYERGQRTGPRTLLRRLRSPAERAAPCELRTHQTHRCLRGTRATHTSLPPPPLPRTIASAAPPSAAWPIGCSHLCSLTPSSAPWTIGAA